jgi:hypothetical protein
MLLPSPKEIEDGHGSSIELLIKPFPPCSSYQTKDARPLYYADILVSYE